MQLGIGKTLFPAWSASITLVKDHGTSAVDHAKSAIRAGEGGTRLDHAVRAMTSFDHAIDNTRELPVQWFVPKAGKYFRGYEVARQAVNLLVGSGLIPGAKERVGRQWLMAAKDAFTAGVQVSRTEDGRFGRYLSSGWLNATAEDALNGVKLLPEGETGRALLAGIGQARAAIDRKQQVDENLARTVAALFDKAASELATIERFAPRTPTTNVDGGAFARSEQLLVEAQQIAAELVADASRIERELPTKKA